MYISIKPIWIPVIVAGALMTTSADAMEAEFPEPRTDRISVEHRVNVLDRELDLNHDQEGQLTTLFTAQDSQRRDFWHTSRAVTSTEICEMRDRHLENQGTIVMTGGNVSSANSARVTNQPAALIDFVADAFLGTTGPVTNRGEFRKSAGSGRGGVGSAPFNNHGVVTGIPP